ncbi:MAG: hypothetical protein CM15mV55_350 [uncultured marine virus]|nr:MAG: hypothetical protein CM15mV55_350 [uncultured marine virus]
MVRLQKLDEVANLYNKTKDPKYKDQWYKLIEEFANGIDNTDRRIVSFNTRRKRNVQGLNFSKKSYVNLL